MSDHRSLTRLFLRHRTQGRPYVEEHALLDRCVDEVLDLPSGHMVTRAGDPVMQSTLLLQGFMCRSTTAADGAQQLLAIHVPGDFVDLHGFPLSELEHDVVTLGPARVAIWRHDTLDRVTRRDPPLMRMLWYATLLDAAIHREWIFRLGRLGAEARVAHLICELYTRLATVGLTRNGDFHLPMKQIELAEACGLTHIHVNRVLRSIRERGIMTFRSREVSIHDPERLRALCAFDPAYLYIDAQRRSGEDDGDD